MSDRGVFPCFSGTSTVTSLLTLLTPLAARTNLPLFLAVRVVEGLGEGVTFPAMLAMISRWSAPYERSRFTAFSFAGGTAGTVISLPVSAVMCETLGWPSVFYLFGVLGLVWFLVWSLLVHDGPELHPGISQEERQLLQVCHRSDTVQYMATIIFSPV